MQIEARKQQIKSSLNGFSKQQLVEKLFQQYDKDGNSTISKFQFASLIRGLFKILGNQYPTNQDIDDIFNQLDINGDQNISKNELMTLVQKLFLIINILDFENKTLSTDE